jgi:hypothetical protein
MFNFTSWFARVSNFVCRTKGRTQTEDVGKQSSDNNNHIKEGVMDAICSSHGREDTFCSEYLTRGEHVDGRIIITTRSSGKN